MQKIKYDLRTAINQTVFRDNIFEKYLKEIQKRTGKKELHSLNYTEVANLLTGHKIRRPTLKTYILAKSNNWKPATGKDTLNIIRAFDRSEQKDEITGMVASKGFYKGRVKIIPFDLKKDISKEISKMKKGDVLVTGSTGPEMILACKKAGAIVTEEGGICSHAAIVSRELGIPCVIATKIATRVLKDGDMIEVDANKGTVRKIK